MSAANPFLLSEGVQQEFRRYIDTTFPILDEELKRAVDQRIKEESLLWKGPYVTLRPPLRRTVTVHQLIQDGVLDGGLDRTFGKLHLFAHQEKAIRLLAGGSNLLLSSGTGSGKTESFLIPIVDHCLRAKRQQGGDKPGVKAVIIYPMNALANDQLKRLRDVLRGTGVTFARLSSETPPNEDGRPGEIPAEERWSRTAIRNTPPDILLTNYAMLEHVLVRHDEHWEIFENRQLRFVVLDEVHTFTGARGVDVAFLVRRLKQRASRNPADVRCAGTSATLARGATEGDAAEAREALQVFAAKVFGVPFTLDELVVEEPVPVEKPETRDRLPAPRALTPADLDVATEEGRLALASKLLGRKVTKVPDAIEGLRSSVAFQEVVARLREAPATVEELADLVGEHLPDRKRSDNEQRAREVVAYLLLGASLGHGQDPLVKIQVHMWYRGIRDFTRCIDPACGELHTDGQDTCRECRGLTLPLEVCRSCGQDFLKTRIRQPNLAEGETTGALQPNDDETDEDTLHLAPKGIRREGAEDEDADAAPAPPSRRRPQASTVEFPTHACNHCGLISTPDKERRPCERGGCTGSIYRYPTWSGKILSCPACQGRYGTSEVVTLFTTATAASVSVLTRALLARLPEAQQRLLIFADNRQDTAYQAGYLRDRHRQFTIRQIIYDAIQKAETEKRPGHDLASLSAVLLEEAVRIGIERPPENPRDRERRRQDLEWELLREFFRRANRRLSLEGLGLIEVRFPWLAEQLANDPRVDELARACGQDRAFILTILEATLHEMRLNRAANHPALKSYDSADARARRLLPDETLAVGYAETRDYTRDYRVRGFFASPGSAWFQDFLSRLHVPVGARDFATTMVAILNDAGYIIREQIGRQGGQARQTWRMNHQRLTFHLPAGLWRCTQCRRHHTRQYAACTAFRCKGELRPAEVDDENLYVWTYTKSKPVKVVPAEHSGQLGTSERQDAEKDFREGRRNVLVCTPTMELGVDIGDLATVLMRNAPPNPANYVQRAGRAGRSQGAIALVNTFTQPTSHDIHFYAEPQGMLSGEIRPPRLNLANLHLIKRQARSIVLSNVEQSLPRTLWEVIDPDTRRLRNINGLLAEIEANADDLSHSVAKAFDADPELQIRPEWVFRHVVEPFGQDVQDAFKPLLTKLDNLLTRLAGIPQLDLSDGAERERRVLRAQINRLFGRNREGEDTPTAMVTRHLQTAGFLPGYGFPAESVILMAGDRLDPITRDPAIALQEFAPHNLIYVDGSRYQVDILTLDEADRANARKPLKFCPKCDWVEIDANANHCDKCGEKLADPQPWISPLGAIGVFRGNVSSEEESRLRSGYETSTHRLGESGQEAFRHSYTGAPYGIAGREIRDGVILFVNHGLRGAEDKADPFLVHRARGHVARSDDVERQARILQQHPGKFDPAIIAYEHKSDLFIIKMENIPNEQAALPTIEAAMLLAARMHLDINEGELRAFIQRLGDEKQPRELVFYENIPGGVGYLSPIARDLPRVGRLALEHLIKCPCEKACYRCLKTYWNQQYHQLLDKRLILDALNELANAGSEAEKVDAPVVASPQLTDGVGYDSPAEAAVAHALIQAGMPAPKIGWQIKHPGGLLIARADLAYPDQKVAVFVDGEAYHSSARQRADDEEQREALEEMGWKVRRVQYARFAEDAERYIERIRRAMETS